MASLDNPIWHALSTVHAAFAEGEGLAKRYQPDVTIHAALKENSPQAFAALSRLMGLQDVAVLLFEHPPRLPKGWRAVQEFRIKQMVCEEPLQNDSSKCEIEKLGPNDVPEMLRLVDLAKPGPFRRRTIELGGYIGIRGSGRLVAMAGRRFCLRGFSGISAVCTHPDFRGRGYAQALILASARAILKRNEIPFLGVRENNAGALRLYEKLGFNIRRNFYLAILKKPEKH